jgi:hypothetical protein
MLIRPFSDLHCELWAFKRLALLMDKVVPPLPTDCETVAVIAGDMGLAHIKESWLSCLEILSPRFLAVVYVEGNHFFWRNRWFDRIAELKQQVALPGNVHFLENGAVEINGVLFTGATLWTSLQDRNPFIMMEARHAMLDFEQIMKPNSRLLKPEDTVDRFEASKEFIFKTLRESAAKKKVVVTHHGISPLSIDNRFKGASINHAFMTDLDSEITENGPDLWVHGHMHNSCDYLLGKTRVIVNSYGYMDREMNPHYDRTLVVEI